MPKREAAASHGYHSYTLRLSQVATTSQWRATLFCAQTSERHHFADLEELYAFLLQATTGCEPQLDAPQGHDSFERGGDNARCETQV